MRLRNIRNSHPLAYAAAACALAVVCFNAVPVDALDPLTASLSQTVLAALCMFGVLAAFDPASLKGRRQGSASIPPFPLACGSLLLMALAAGIVSALLLPPGGPGGGPRHSLDPAASPEGVALFLLLCLATGAFEEALFRGIVFKGFAAALAKEGRNRPVLVAALVQALVFGLLHVTTSTSLAPAASGAVAAVQTAAKPLQAALFGFVMAGVFARTGSLWLLVGAHAAFNALSEAPLFVLTGSLPSTYATGQPADLAVLLATTVLLVPLAVSAARFLKRTDHQG